MQLRIRIPNQRPPLRVGPAHPERVSTRSIADTSLRVIEPDVVENLRIENNARPINVSKAGLMTIPMDSRSEARFSVKCPAKVTLQRNGQSELRCTLVDISATGIGLIIKESLPVDELIVLETEQHLVLAKVRHCGPRGDGLSVGLERIQTVLADSSESGKTEQRSALFRALQSWTPSEAAPAQPSETGPAFCSTDISEPLVSSDLPSQQELQKIQAAMLPGQAQQEPIEPGPVDAELIRLRYRSYWRIPLGIAAAVVVGSLMLGFRPNSAKSDPPPIGAQPSFRSGSGVDAQTGTEDLMLGKVIHKALPDVPKRASDTIRGKVAVRVRVRVDAAGNVVDSELHSRGPSRYFAELALHAAPGWKFEPPKVEGRAVISEWILRFEFKRFGADAVAVRGVR